MCISSMRRFIVIQKLSSIRTISIIIIIISLHSLFPGPPKKLLGGGFNHFLFSSRKLGEMESKLIRSYFWKNRLKLKPKKVETTTNPEDVK